MNKTTPTIQNRKAHYNYFILESLEAGIVLSGCEIKSIRQGQANLQDSFARIEKLEVYLYGMHISSYDHGNRYNLDPMRIRKLLLNRKEIFYLTSRVQEKGLTLIPVQAYFKNGRVKIQLALAKGKTHGDKREKLKEKESNLYVQRALKFKNQ